MHSLDWRINRALELRKEGYNCTQTVLMVFDDATNIDEELAARIAAGLGSGVAATGEICGVPNAMGIVAGLIGGSKPTDKVIAMRWANPDISKFQDLNDGKIRCCDLKNPENPRGCNDLIIQGIEILHNHLVESGVIS